MSSTFSTNLRTELIGTGDQAGNWGGTTNTNLGSIMEQAIAGVSGGPYVGGTYPVVNFPTDADITLTANNGSVDQARSAVLVVTSSGSLTATRNVIAPASASKIYIIKNSTTGGQSIQIKYATGTGVTITNGTVVLVFGDGANFYVGTSINSVTGNLTTTGSITASGSYYNSQAVTSVTVASPGVVTLPVNASGLINNTSVFFTLATGATLPTGLSANTVYYITNLAVVGSTTTFNLSATSGGTAINTTGSASTGTVTINSPPVSAISALFATNSTNTNNLVNNNWSTNATPTINTFTGAISSTTLTVSATSVTVRPGAILSGTSVTANTQITNQLTSTGTAVVSPTFSSGGAIGAYTVTLSAGTSIVLGQLVSGTGLASNTLVTAINGATITLSNAFTVQAAGTYSFYTPGGVGTYTVSIAQTASSTTITQNYAKISFIYNSTTVASLDPLGNFIAAGNVTAYGTP